MQSCSQIVTTSIPSPRILQVDALPVAPTISFRALNWDYVKDDVESLGLPQKDVQSRNKWRRRIKGTNGSPGKKSWVMECDGITFHRLAYPKLTWASCIIVLTAIGYLLLGETVAKHLVSPPIPVPQQYHVNSIVG